MQIGRLILMTKEPPPITVYLGKNLVSWVSQNQKVVSRSSTKVEYRSIAKLTEKIWIQSLLTELGISPATPTIYSDNLGAILMQPIL